MRGLSFDGQAVPASTRTIGANIVRTEFTICWLRVLVYQQLARIDREGNLAVAVA
jgi:hypothetical protein